MLENWLKPQLHEDGNDYIFQQDGSPAHYTDVRGYLNRNLPQRWIGRTGKEDGALMRWPPRSPDLTQCDFFFWGCCAQHTTHNHNQAHSKQRTTHTQKHDMLPQHQS